MNQKLTKNPQKPKKTLTLSPNDMFWHVIWAIKSEGRSCEISIVKTNKKKESMTKDKVRNGAIQHGAHKHAIV